MTYFFINYFSKCNLFEKKKRKNTAVVCFSCPFEFDSLLSIDDIGYKTSSKVMFSFKQYLIINVCKMGNCLKGREKEKLIAKDVLVLI